MINVTTVHAASSTGYIPINPNERCLLQTKGSSSAMITLCWTVSTCRDVPRNGPHPACLLQKGCSTVGGERVCQPRVSVRTIGGHGGGGVLPYICCNNDRVLMTRKLSLVMGRFVCLSLACLLPGPSQTIQSDTFTALHSQPATDYLIE